MQTLSLPEHVLHFRPVVLTVDEADNMRDALRLVLEDECDVIEAQNGAAALDLVRERRVDLVLLDVLMPGIDGLEVLAQVRSIRHDLKVVLVTAVDSASMAVQAMKLGALDYLTKPFEIAVLRNIVRQVLAAPPVTVIGDDVGLRAAVAVFPRVLRGVDVRSYSLGDFSLRHGVDEGGQLIDLTATTDVPKLLSAFTGVHIATDITPRCVESPGPMQARP